MERLVTEVGVPDVAIAPYPDHSSDGDHCFVLKRKDPRHEDHSQMEVLLTCRVDMPGVEFLGDYAEGRLTKVYVNGGGWLWSLAVEWVREMLDPGQGEQS